MSNAYAVFQDDHRFFTILGANLGTCWHKKFMKILPHAVQEVVEWYCILQILLLRFDAALGANILDPGSP